MPHGAVGLIGHPLGRERNEGRVDPVHAVVFDQVVIQIDKLLLVRDGVGPEGFVSTLLEVVAADADAGAQAALEVGAQHAEVGRAEVLLKARAASLLRETKILRDPRNDGIGQGGVAVAVGEVVSIIEKVARVARLDAGVTPAQNLLPRERARKGVLVVAFIAVTGAEHKTLLDRPGQRRIENRGSAKVHHVVTIDDRGGIVIHVVLLVPLVGNQAGARYIRRVGQERIHVDHHVARTVVSRIAVEEVSAVRVVLLGIVREKQVEAVGHRVPHFEGVGEERGRQAIVWAAPVLAPGHDGFGDAQER